MFALSLVKAVAHPRALYCSKYQWNWSNASAFLDALAASTRRSSRSPALHFNVGGKRSTASNFDCQSPICILT
jgi:hypothetical protein